MTKNRNGHIVLVDVIKSITMEDLMVTRYNGYYRTCLSVSEKEDFRKLAQKEGSVTEVHDNLIRIYIKSKEEKRDTKNDASYIGSGS